MKEVMMRILKSVPWKKALYQLYTVSLKPELQKMVLKTESKWDDAALNAADMLIEKFLKD